MAVEPHAAQSGALPPATAPPAPSPPQPRRTATGEPAALLALAKPLPFPPLELMHDRTRTVTHALARSKRAAEGAKGKERATDDDDRGGAAGPALRWKAGVAPGQAARRLFPKPNFAQRAYRRFFIKRDLKYVRPPPPSLVVRFRRRPPHPLRAQSADAHFPPTAQGRAWTPQELDEAAARGNFPHRPSDLFLKVRLEPASLSFP